MYKEFHDILALDGGTKPLAYEGDSDGDRWANGTLKTADGTPEIEVVNGVPFLAGEAKDPWGDDTRVTSHFEKLGQTPTGVVEGGFELASTDKSRYSQFATELIEVAGCGGRILEVACGHGGGFAPYLLKKNPEASLLMTDLGRWIVAEWQKLSRTQDWPGFSCAQVDPANLPFKDESFKALVSLGGYTNLMPDSPLFKEAYRVLEPGGLFFILDARPDPSAFRKFPTAVREQLKKQYPTFGIGYMEFVRKLGFSKGEFLETGRRPMTARGGPVAETAKRHKVRLEICFCKILARK